MRKSISLDELANCQTYAERIVSFYEKCNKGKLPMTATEADMAVREYNKEFRSFKSLFGYSIRGYIEYIVDCIGLIVEA